MAHTVMRLWAKPQTATSMRGQTAMFTRTPGAVGTKPREAVLLRVAGGRKRAAGHRPLAEAAGNPGPRVLAVRQASVVVAAGIAGRSMLLAQIESTFLSSVGGKEHCGSRSGGVMTLKYRGLAFTTRLLLCSAIIFFVGCNRSEKASSKTKASSNLFVSPQAAGDALH